MSAVAERPRKHWMTRHETPFKEGGSRRSRIHGYFEIASRLQAGSHRSWPNKDNIDLTTTTLRVGRLIGQVSFLKNQA